MTGWITPSLAAYRASGRAFHCYEPGAVAPGFYRFVGPQDEEPIGPFEDRFLCAAATTAPEKREPLRKAGRAITGEPKPLPLFTEQTAEMMFT